MDVTINPSEEERLLTEWFETTSYVEAEEWDDDEVPDATWADDDEDTYEEKVVRHVRTPEGAARYGQPIGSVIVADVHGNPMPHSIDPEPQTEMSAAMASILSGLDEQKPTWASFTQLGGKRRSQTRIANYDLQVFDPDGAGGLYVWRVNTVGQQLEGVPLAEGVEKSSLAARTAAEEFARSRRDEYQKRPKKRKVDNVFDYWEGIVGYDYWPDGREVTDEDIEKFDDPDYRYDLALKTLNGMGIQVLSDSPRYDMDVNAMETFAAVMNAHEQMFPGFSDLVSATGVAKHGNAVAFNQTDMFTDYRNWKTQIMFNPDYYGDTPRAYENLAGVKTRERGWWSTDAHELDTAYGEEFENFQLRMLPSTVHELGHTFGRIGLGQLRTDKYDASEPQAYFTESLYNMFYNWGILMDEGMDLDEFRMGVDQENTRTNPYSYAMMNFDSAILREVLSEYGGTSIHEMCAEAWAEYMLDPNPRAFAVELGTILEETMQIFLDSKKA